MTGVLYIVATPIGNLDDMSLRAISTLKAVTLIAAEDTRHSRHLLNHFSIDTRMISCHEHNEQSRVEQILGRLEDGEDVALISDAGTPLISDPGYRLVSAARQRGIRVSPIPGANSAIAALSAAGLPTDRFHFCGFLSSRQAERARQLESMRGLPGTLVMFESGRRICPLLRQLTQIFPQQACAIAKELTKLHEQMMQGSAQELLACFEAEEQLSRGEFVVLVDNSAQPAGDEADPDTARILRLLLDELSVKKAVKIAVDLTGKKKNQLYELALQLSEDDRPEISN